MRSTHNNNNKIIIIKYLYSAYTFYISTQWICAKYLRLEAVVYPEN